ncbi:hypothetical protein HK104_003138 [Borealophlyctis nickersoniae]|nr:hypothetical protein HK104_003138 [Borealophlyctis nickersoniae]
MSVTVSVGNLPGSTSLIQGVPGLTRFSIAGVISVKNTSPGKTKNIHSLAITLSALTTSKIHQYKTIYTSRLPHYSNAVVLLPPPTPQSIAAAKAQKGAATGATQDPNGPLPPGAQRDYQFSFNIAGPLEGGPAWLPIPMERETGDPSEFTRTEWVLQVVLEIPRQTFGPEKKSKSIPAPLYWYSINTLVKLLQPIPNPPPGWKNGTPVSMPATATAASSRKVDFEFSLPEGCLIFEPGVAVPFTLRAVSLAANVRINTAQLYVKQYITARAGNAARVWKHVCFTISIPGAQLATLVSRTFTIPPPANDVKLRESRNPDNANDICQVAHKLKLRLDLSGDKDIEVACPIIVSSWGKTTMNQFATANATVFSAVVQGLVHLAQQQPQPPQYTH